MAVLLLGFPLAVLAALFWYYGGALAARSTSQGLLGFLAQLLRYVPLAGPVSADLVIKLDQWLAHHLGVAFEQIFHRGVQFITGINQYLVLMAKTAVTWPLDLFNVLNYLVWHKIPQLVGLQTKPIAREAAQATATAEAAMKAAVGVAKSHPGAVSVKEITVIKKVTLPHAHNWDWINAHWKGLTRAVSLAATGAIATTIPVALPRDVPWGRTAAQIRRMLRRVAWVGAFAGPVALVAVALQRMGLSWIRCNNVRRLGRGLCGAPGWLINLLAVGIVEAFVVSDLCRFSDLLIKEAEKIRPALLELVDVEDALIGCHGTVKPIDFKLAPLSLPPMYSPSALAA